MLVNYDIEERRKAKMLSDDRVIVLRPIPGKDALTAQGGIDKKIFTGENKLHVTYNARSNSWSMHLDSGALPGGLQGTWTTFKSITDHISAYYAKRNVEIAEIIQ
jgi:hypothetical protein